jgi:CHAT domain-containing protein
MSAILKQQNRLTVAAGTCLALVSVPPMLFGQSKVTLPTRMPTSITEQVVNSWLPDLANFQPPSGSPEMELREIAQLTLKGRFKDAIVRLDKLEKFPSLIRERLWLCKLWRLEIDQRQYRFPSGASGITGASVEASKGVDVEKERWIEEVDKSRSNDLQCATHFILGIIDELTTLDAAVLRFRADVEDSTDAPFEQSPGFLHFLFVEEGVRKFHVLPTTVIDVLDADIRGQLAAAQRRWGEAEQHFQRGLTISRDAKLPRTESMFLMRLGDLVVSPYGHVETLGMSLETEFGIRPPLSRPFQPKDAVPLGSDLVEKARSYYTQSGTVLSVVDGPTPNAALTLRQAYLEFISRHREAAIDRYTTAAIVAKKQGDVLQYAYALTAKALILRERKSFEDAATALWDANYPGALFQIAAFARGYANRLHLLALDPVAATTCVRMASDALRARKLDQEASEFLITEVSFGNALGQLDRMIDLIQDVRHSIAARQISANEEARAAVRRGDFATDIWLLNTTLGQYYLDWDPLWIKKAEGVLVELNRYATNDPSERAEIERVTADVDHCKCIARVRRARGTETFATVLKQEWIRAQASKDRVFTCRLGTYAGSDVPEVREAAAQVLMQLAPVDDLNQAQVALVNAPSQNAVRIADLAYSNLAQLLGYAAQLEAIDTLDRWIGEIDKLVDSNPAWERWRSTAREFRAWIALGRNDASTARQMFRELLAPPIPGRPSIEHAPQEAARFRYSMLSGLLEAEAAIGDAPEESLLEYVQLGFEKAGLEMSRANIQGDRRLAFELAMLSRTSAINGSLSLNESHRKMDIEKLLGTTDFGKKPVTPMMNDLRDALSRLPRGATTLVFYFGRKQTIAWRLEKGEVVRMARIEKASAQLEAQIVAFRAMLERNLSGWEANAAELYRILFAPLGPFENSRPLIIAESSLLTSIPVELLGPDPETPLLATNPCAYAARLGVFESAEEVPQATNAPIGTSVVVGIDGVSLDYAEIEARSVAATLNVKPVCGADATIANVSERLRSARWVHLATHASLDLRNPFRSSLQLADGPLEAWQLLRLAPNVDTVVLSACDTTAPANSVAGLNAESATLAAFAFAGQARWVMASLWKADDATTCQFMAKFYDILTHRGKGHAEALREAKLELRHEGRTPNKYANMALMVANPGLIREGSPSPAPSATMSR